MEFSGWLSITVFCPLMGALVIAFFLKNPKLVRGFSISIAIVELFLSATVFGLYRIDAAEQFQLIDRFESWIPFETFNVQYYLGIDGLSAPLVLLTGLLGLVAIFSSWNVTERVKEHYMWLLVLQSAVMGVFTSLDFFLFFLFWELELLPMFFLISIWGTGRKEYSAMKFLIFTLLGSAFMLVGILALYFSTSPHTFDMTLLPSAVIAANLIMPAATIFIFLFIGFAIKLPVWPFHTWLPDAHTDAPTAASVILAGVLLKMGGYGMLRVLASFFPGLIAEWAWMLALLGVINILYGAAATIRQTDLKRLIAFSSISHMGFVLLGISSVAGVAGHVSPLGLTGAALQMFTHGTITGMLFLVVGFIYEKCHTRYIPELGGLASKMPFLASALLLAGLASLGLPGTSGFVAELTIFLGTFPTWKLFTILGTLGIVLAAGYILWMIQRTLFGARLGQFNTIKDASLAEMFPVGALAVVILAVGIYPALITDVFSEGVQPIIDSIEQSLGSMPR